MGAKEEEELMKKALEESQKLAQRVEVQAKEEEDEEMRMINEAIE